MKSISKFNLHYFQHLIFLIFFFTGNKFLYAQYISGNLKLLTNQQIKLEGFNGFKTYSIDSVTINEKGSFTLNYSKADYGVAYLISNDEKPLFVILNEDDIEIIGETCSNIETLKVTKGKETQILLLYTKEYLRREQALNAWSYLEKLYQTDTLFAAHHRVFKNIQSEIKRIKFQDSKFIEKLPIDTYVSWLFSLRKLLNSVSAVAQYRPEEIPATRNALKKINYADPRLLKSGLLKEALENHIWFIENSSGTTDSVFAHINTSLHIIIGQLQGNEAVFNEVTHYLLSLLEKRGMLASAEFLALKILNEARCTLNQDLHAQLEGYRKLKIGNIAPNITFGQHTYFAEGVQAASLMQITEPYKLVVFAAGWCGHCTQEIPKLAQYYSEWKKKGVEIVLVSLDESINDFVKFTAPFPFTSTTDFRKWESQPVKDYFISGTPTFLLLKNNLEIILKPQSVQQLKDWIDGNLTD